MGNYLTMADWQRIGALLELGWTYPRRERETGVRRETAASCDPLRAAIYLEQMTRYNINATAGCFQMRRKHGKENGI
jgi:hypothetical protein